MHYKGVKYACGTCIKGHRSSQCTHTERPLFEIRKKGRPATQCSLCRDLRKTKQIHIKCACTHKSTKVASAAVLDIHDKCTCPDLNHDHHLPTTTFATTQDDFAGCATHHVNALSSGDEYNTPLLPSPPLSATTQQQQQQLQQQQQQQQPSSMLDANFAWAFVTTPAQEDSLLTNEDMNTTSDLGFLFRKPSSRRFLDGQPRPPRKKSMKKQQQQQHITTNSATTTTIDNNTLQEHNDVILFMDTSLSSSSSTSSCADGNDNMFSADVAMFLDQVLQHHHMADNQDLGTNLEVTHTTTNNNNWLPPTTTTSSPSTYYLSSDYCGMHPGICRSKHTTSGPGESVLITVTPIITSSSSSDLQGKVRTRLATCYCSGDCCHCPGCLVHPGAADAADAADAAWYSNPLASTTSSTYSTSDDEDYHHHQQQQPALLRG